MKARSAGLVPTEPSRVSRILVSEEELPRAAVHDEDHVRRAVVVRPLRVHPDEDGVSRPDRQPAFLGIVGAREPERLGEEVGSDEQRETGEQSPAKHYGTHTRVASHVETTFTVQSVDSNSSLITSHWFA